MRIESLALNTEYFTIEHLAPSPENRKLIEGFKVANKASGLETYLKIQAEIDETSKGSRTYLVKDSVSGELACYFSLRNGLITLKRNDGLFDTIPGIELANFAVNEAYRRKGAKVGKVGGYVFRKFILPIAKHVSELVGAQSLYIYALPEGKLIEYYRSLEFRRLPPEAESFVYSHVKPAYDQGCIFMSQDL